jgi:hypothetical protein
VQWSDLCTVPDQNTHTKRVAPELQGLKTFAEIKEFRMHNPYTNLHEENQEEIAQYSKLSSTLRK